MAKLAFSKLGLKPNNNIGTFIYNDLSIEVKDYLPVNNKLELIGNVINSAVDDNGYYNEGKVRIYFVLEVINAYTNLAFTDKQKEDPCKLYDLLVGNEIWAKVWDLMLASEKEFLENCLNKTIHAIYEYKNSVMGILDIVSQDYANMNLDARNIQQALADPENMALLKDVLTKLG